MKIKELCDNVIGIILVTFLIVFITVPWIDYFIINSEESTFSLIMLGCRAIHIVISVFLFFTLIAIICSAISGLWDTIKHRDIRTFRPNSDDIADKRTVFYSSLYFASLLSLIELLVFTFYILYLFISNTGINTTVFWFIIHPILLFSVVYITYEYKEQILNNKTKEE